MVFHVCVDFALFSGVADAARHAHSAVKYDGIRIMRVVVFLHRSMAIG